jgi:hypothetical protein
MEEVRTIAEELETQFSKLRRKWRRPNGFVCSADAKGRAVAAAIDD